MLYRVVKPLSTGQQPGEWVEGKEFKYLKILLRVGALAPIQAPPLVALPGWKLRAEKLAPAGIVTVLDLLQADDDAVRKALGHKTLRATKQYKQEARDLLQVQRPPGKRVR